MWKPPVIAPTPARFRRVVAVLACVSCLLGTAACTDEPGSAPTAPASSVPPSAATGPSTTIEARPVPLEVEVVRVVGSRMRLPQKQFVERQVARTLSAYFDAAYLGGEYPRTDFSRAFGTFTRGAQARARADRGLLSNARNGGDIVSVRPVRKRALLDVLLPGENVAGITARIRLVLDEEHKDGSVHRITVTGRLLLTRQTGGGWKVFGYDVARSAVPTTNGASR